MKHYKELSQVKLSDIEMYSMPATDENMQNVANLFERATAPAARRDRPRVRPLRALLAAAMAVVMMFSVAMTVSADFREVVFGIFTATNTEQMEKGLLRDSFLIFDEALGDNKTVNLYNGLIYNVLPELMTTDAFFDSYYEYADGVIKQIKTQKIDVSAEYDGVEYRVAFDYGTRSGGEFFVNSNLLIKLDDDDFTFTSAWAIPGRTDAVGLLLNDNYKETAVVFCLETLEITDEEFIYDRALYLEPWFGDVVCKDIYTYLEVHHGKVSTDGSWLAYTEESSRHDLLLYNLQTQTHEKFSITEELLNGQKMWSYTWLADDVLAIVSEGDGFENLAPQGVINLGRHLYVFRIDESFLS